jgi:HPt (histidine-containing phosphotransfer) domain-containing protein
MELGKLKERRASPAGHTTHRRDSDDRQPGDASNAAAKEFAVVRSILNSRSSSLPEAVAVSSSTLAPARDRPREREEEAVAAESGGSRCTFDSMSGDGGGSGLGGAGEGGIVLDSKALNVSASRAFYERASSRRHRLKRALSENSASQAEAIPLGFGGGAGSGLTRKKHRTRGSLLSPELPEAAATAATVESTTKSALGVGARKRAIGDVDPHWNAVLLRKKAREEMERQQLAKRWRGSIISHRNSESRTSSAESAVQSQNMSGTKSKDQSRCHPTGKLKDLKEKQSLYNKLATPRGIEGAAAGVARTSTPGAAKEAPRVERRKSPATAVRRHSAREPSVAQGVLALSSHGKPNGTGAAATV